MEETHSQNLKKIIEKNISEQYDIQTDNNFEIFLNTVTKKINFCNHHFFSLLSKEQYSKNTVGEIMAPFYFAVHNWTIHLSKYYDELILCDQYVSADLVNDNILDENGYCNGKINLESCHTVTFINFLHALGLKSKLSITNPVYEFNNELAEVLDNKNLAYNACVLATIECCYIDISNMISKFCKNVSVEQDHYSIHEIIDLKHTIDLLMAAKNLNATRKDVVDSIMKGYTMLWNVFLGMSYGHNELDSYIPFL